MEIKSILNNLTYLKEYVTLCSLEWGSKKTPEELNTYIKNKVERIKNEGNVISILGLLDQDKLIGFISLLKTDGDERLDLTPWYGTMYVKKEYRGNGYSKLLNNALIKEAKELNFKKVYLKSYLKNYYEKFGAKKIETLINGEQLFYIEL